MLKVGDIREFEGNFVGVVVGMRDDYYVVVTIEGNEVPVRFNTPSKVVRLDHAVRCDLDDIGKLYQKAEKLRVELQYMQKDLFNTEEAIRGKRVSMNYIARGYKR